jgi:hypothetical protein
MNPILITITVNKYNNINNHNNNNHSFSNISFSNINNSNNNNNYNNNNNNTRYNNQPNNSLMILTTLTNRTPKKINTVNKSIERA